MEWDTTAIVVVTVFSAAWILLLVLVLVAFSRVRALRRILEEMQASGRLKVQKLTIKPDKNHAFHNPSITPDEELSRRGYSMYSRPDNDVETGRGIERQTDGHFVEDLQRELENRQQRSTAPPFLLQGIEENKRKSKSYNNNHNHNHNHNHNRNQNHYDSRQSDTNPNFIY